MVPISLIPRQAFQRLQQASLAQRDLLALIADMCRANALAMVKRAGSGHLGSSFSAMEIVVTLYYAQMNTVSLGVEHPDRDIYFSSKGHDVPGLYAVLYALGIIPQDRFVRLRRLGGLDGHPDIGVPGIEANSGSLGMGISKGRGIAWAKRAQGRQGRVYVLIGDGELQEGQNFEALQSAAQQRVTNLTVIVDHNKLQSDKLVSEIVELGDLVEKFRSFGWHVGRFDGHAIEQFQHMLAECTQVRDRPQLLVADTIKGRGISFMEHPAALQAGGGLYRWHAGAPDDASFVAGHRELVERINARLQTVGLSPLELEEIPPESAPRRGSADTLVGEPASKGAASKSPPRGVSDEYVAEAFGQALVALGKIRKDLVVLDADLAADCHIRDFERAYPDRFIENGIAEQDMVSMAGGLARQGMLPVVNSFASFLAARANEQIYNNVGERTKIIYVCHYAGLIPAGPGKSHQSLRDISLLSALPDMRIMQPCNAQETQALLTYCVHDASTNCMMRLNIGPSPRKIQLPSTYRVVPGQGTILAEGVDAVLLAYGPVMLHEALVAHETLRQARRPLSLKVVNMPWLNHVDRVWLQDVVGTCQAVYVLDDHAVIGGLGDQIVNAMMSSDILRRMPITKFGVEGLPACGTPVEALRFHGLDGGSIASRIHEDRVRWGESTVAYSSTTGAS